MTLGFDPEPHGSVEKLNHNKGLEVRTREPEPSVRLLLSYLPTSKNIHNIYITVRHRLPSSHPEEQHRCIALTGVSRLINRFTSNWRDVWNNYQMTAGAAAESRRQSK